MAKLLRGNLIVCLVGFFVVTASCLLLVKLIATDKQPDKMLLETGESKSIWRKYTNRKYKFSLVIPENWVVEELDGREDGYIVSIYSPDKLPLREKGPIVNSYTDDMAIRVFDNINNPYAKGGEGPEEPVYGSLEEFFADKVHYHTVHKIGETFIDGIKMYEIISGGNGQEYGLIMENEDGSLFEIDFPTSWDKSKLSDMEKQILSTFRFLR